MITAIRIREVLQYCPETGQFRWLPRPVKNAKDKSWNTRFAGKVAGSQHKSGYLTIAIDSRNHLAHRLAWLHFYGEMAPKLDHKNGCRNDNRIKNLREATSQENARNQQGWTKSTSKFKGVSWSSEPGRGKRWVASITIDGKRKHLGRFASEEQAHAAYREAAAQTFGEFARF